MGRVPADELRRLQAKVDEAVGRGEDPTFLVAEIEERYQARIKFEGLTKVVGGRSTPGPANVHQDEEDWLA